MRRKILNPSSPHSSLLSRLNFIPNSVHLSPWNGIGRQGIKVSQSCAVSVVASLSERGVLLLFQRGVPLMGDSLPLTAPAWVLPTGSSWWTAPTWVSFMVCSPSGKSCYSADPRRITNLASKTTPEWAPFSMDLQVLPGCPPPTWCGLCQI